MAADASADAALHAEVIQGGRRLGIGLLPPRTQFLPGVSARIPAPPGRATHYLFVAVRDTYTKRHIPRQAVTATVGQVPQPLPLIETWGDFPHYGANVLLAKGLDVGVRVDAAGAAASFRSVEGPAGRRFDGPAPEPAAAGWEVGDDVLLAREALARPPLPAGEWALGVVRSADPALPELVLLDATDGRLVTGAGLTLTLASLTPGAPPVVRQLLPVHEPFDRYRAAEPVPPGTWSATVAVRRPTFATFRQDAHARTVTVTLPSPITLPPPR